MRSSWECNCGEAFRSHGELMAHVEKDHPKTWKDLQDADEDIENKLNEKWR